jgi:hypothetical protein
MANATPISRQQVEAQIDLLIESTSFNCCGKNSHRRRNVAPKFQCVAEARPKPNGGRAICFLKRK